MREGHGRRFCIFKMQGEIYCVGYVSTESDCALRSPGLQRGSQIKAEFVNSGMELWSGKPTVSEKIAGNLDSVNL